MLYTDPNGEFFFLIPSISWGKGGFSIGFTGIIGIPGVASIQGGVNYNFKGNDLSVFAGATAAFNTVYTSFSTQSGFSVGWSLGISPQMGFPISTNFTSMGVNYNITHNSLSGNLSAWNIDKSGISFNPSISSMIYPEHVTNLARGKGFNSNNKVLKNFMSSGSVNKYNDALKYFGFEGIYDSSIGVRGMFDPNDGLIKINKTAFESYDMLQAVYQEELFHSKDYIYAKNNTPKDVDPWFYEEWRAQKHQYRNQGLYLKSGHNWIDRINDYGRQGGILDYTPRYSAKWWHFLYKIPRKW